MLNKFCNAQGQDAIWYFGDSAGIYFTNGNATPLTNSHSYSSESGTTVCDKQGNLLFYAGYNWQGNFYVWNNQHQVMMGSNLITNVDYTNTFTQGILNISMPGDSNKYYLFTEYTTTNIDLQYHIIGMTLDSGNGGVDTANINVTSGSNLSEKMNAIRHANGRDWWLILAYRPDFVNSLPGYFISFLITPNGIGSPNVQYIGPGYDSYGQLVFSPDGTKMLVADISRGLNLYDFDRCSGQLSNWIELGFPPYSINNLDGFYGCSFSSSGRYIYASRLDSLFQYDVLSPNVILSRIFLGKTGFISEYWLGQHKLGQDGKIYIANFDYTPISSMGLDKFMNVINYPDSAGVACGVSLYSFSLGDKRSRWGMPNIPNYNLGPVWGSVCDSISGIAESKDPEVIQVYPNPANNEITFSNPGYQTAFITIYNVTGEKIISQSTKGKEAKINTRIFNEGIYFYVIDGGTPTLHRGKFCIIHN